VWIARFALCVLTTGMLAAQSGGLSQRVGQVFAGTSAADEAAASLENKDYAAVERLLAAIPQPEDRTRADILSLRGVLAFMRGDMKQAAAEFNAAEAVTQLSDQDAFTQAMAYVSLGDRERARGALGRLARTHPERSLYLYWLGRLDFDEHRYEDASIRLQNAAKLNPESARVWDSLGLTFDMQGNDEGARMAFERSVKLNRTQQHPSPWPPHDFGCWLMRTNRLNDAEAAFREALQYDVSFPQAHYHLGRTLDKEGRNTEALNEYLTAVKSDPASPEFCYSLAILYRKLHRDSDATAMFAEYRRRRQATP
jgi:tetratricopeptide (TPR) repeat protein